MTAPARPELEPGRVYRTRDFAPWSANPPRLAKRLVREGSLVRLTHGLFAHPIQGRFGAVPPSDQELLRAFLDGGPFVVTGPARWNALGLGATAMFATPLVYNTKRSGVFDLGGRTFILRRVAFPDEPTAEWFLVDLFEHADQAGTSKAELTERLRRALAAGRFDPVRLQAAAATYGSKDIRARIASALPSAA